MPGKAVISLTTGLEDPEKVTVAFLVALGAVEGGRPTLMFLAKEAVRLAVDGVAKGVACATCPPIPELFERYERAGGRYLVCPICVDAKQIDKGDMLPNAEVGGTVGGHGDGLRPRSGREHGEPGPLQIRADKIPQLALVLHDQHRRRHRRSPRFP